MSQKKRENTEVVANENEKVLNERFQVNCRWTSETMSLISLNEIQLASHSIFSRKKLIQRIDSLWNFSLTWLDSLSAQVQLAFDRVNRNRFRFSFRKHHFGHQFNQCEQIENECPIAGQTLSCITSPSLAPSRFTSDSNRRRRCLQERRRKKSFLRCRKVFAWSFTSFFFSMSGFIFFLHWTFSGEHIATGNKTTISSSGSVCVSRRLSTSVNIDMKNDLSKNLCSSDVSCFLTGIQ